VTDADRARAVLAALEMTGSEPEPLAAGLSSHAWRIRSQAADLVLPLPVHLEDGVGSYPLEHAALARLTALGARIPAPVQGSWQIPGWSLDPFSLTSFVAGVPLRAASHRWAAAQIATFLAVLHSIPVTGFGPLDVAGGGLLGRSVTAEDGLRAAFDGFSIWPFDPAALSAHSAWPEGPERLAGFQTELQAQAELVADAAAARPAVIVHSDLHEQNILEDHGQLGFIDFGECFVGAAGWDFAAIAYFAGWQLAERVLAAYRDEPSATQLDAERIAALALSFGLYRWQQDRRLGIDGDTYNTRFLRDTLARLRR